MFKLRLLQGIQKSLYSRYVVASLQHAEIGNMVIFLSRLVERIYDSCLLLTHVKCKIVLCPMLFVNKCKCKQMFCFLLYINFLTSCSSD
jgi:hypothetical protein